MEFKWLCVKIAGMEINRNSLKVLMSFLGENESERAPDLCQRQLTFHIYIQLNPPHTCSSF